MTKNIENGYTCVRERTYAMEEKFFSPFAVKSKDTKGRAREEEPCSMRTDFQRDRDRIIYSNSFKRLKNKTQVFVAPEGDHYITRLTHTLDVSQIARSIARALCEWRWMCMSIRSTKDDEKWYGEKGRPLKSRMI